MAEEKAKSWILLGSKLGLLFLTFKTEMLAIENRNYSIIYENHQKSEYKSIAVPAIRAYIEDPGF